MRNLHISINDKVATYYTRDGNIVCGNSDYQIVFTFDSEWDAYESKTVRYIWNGNYVDVAFSGNTVVVPIITKTNLLKVGVYAGELCTTTSAEIPCVWSVLCESATQGSPDTPGTGGEVIDLTNYITRTELEEGYYTKEQVDEKIENASPDVDLSNYYTKAEIDALLENVQAGGKPIAVSSEEELKAGKVGSIYTYTGESGTFENGAMYFVEEGE